MIIDWHALKHTCMVQKHSADHMTYGACAVFSADEKEVILCFP